MSQSRDLHRHMGQLEDIRYVLNSMKNIAFMEIHKLNRYQNRQSLALVNIENTATDFLDFFPGFALETECREHICIIVGTERGFCGDFNERLIAQAAYSNFSGLIVIGSRLANRLADINLPILSYIAGANTSEEVPHVIDQLIDDINDIVNEQNQSIDNPGETRISILYHGSATDPLYQRQILPPFKSAHPHINRSQGISPRLNLEPGQFFSELIHHYLFALLNELFYISLITENHSRLLHLDSAIEHLDRQCTDLRRKAQILRQEEITEEIEIILLNTENT